MDGHEHGGAENEREEQRFRRWNRKVAHACAADEPGPYSADAGERSVHVSDLPCFEMLVRIACRWAGEEH